MRQKLKSISQRILPSAFRSLVLQRTRRPPIGEIDFGHLRQLNPISRAWGVDRGLPVDRYYIEKFLSYSKSDIHGRVLEIGDNNYTTRFGGAKVIESDVLYPVSGNPAATIVADLTAAPKISNGTFDCIICIQTLQFIPDYKAALRTLYRILKPEGTLLVTVPTISQLDISEKNVGYDQWRFTSYAVKWLFKKTFDTENITIKAYGNVMAAICFLHGIATEELMPEELDYFDPYYELLVSVKAVKKESNENSRP